MAISICCPTCERKYRVKESASGKKLRCQNCETVIPIPVLDTEFEAEPDPPDLEPDVAAPPVVRRRRSKSRSQQPDRARREQAGPAIPLTVLLAMLIEGLLIAFNGFNLVTGLAAGQGNLLGLAGTAVRVALEIAIVVGLWQGWHLARMAAMILSGLGIAFVALCGGMMLLFAGQQQVAAQIPGGKALLLAALGLQALMSIAQIVALLSDSATDYCNH
jgi:hypothetical protein